jgi:hypothetical protein
MHIGNSALEVVVATAFCKPVATTIKDKPKPKNRQLCVCKTTEKNLNA